MGLCNHSIWSFIVLLAVQAFFLSFQGSFPFIMSIITVWSTAYNRKYKIGLQVENIHSFMHILKFGNSVSLGNKLVDYGGWTKN